jgi:hypothetical protein
MSVIFLDCIYPSPWIQNSMVQGFGITNEKSGPSKDRYGPRCEESGCHSDIPPPTSCAISSLPVVWVVDKITQ